MRRSLPLSAKRILVALALLLTLAVPYVASAADGIVLDDVNLRSGPGLDYDVLAVLPADATVTLAGEPVEGWYPVLFEDLEGWVYGAYLAVPLDSGAGGSGDLRSTAAAVLNLRAGPGLDYDILAELDYGTTVELLGGVAVVDGFVWVEVRVGDLGEGWVAEEYLAAAEPAADMAALELTGEE